MEIKLRQDLLDDRILNLVGYDKNNLPKIYLLSAPEGTLAPYIEYQVITNRGTLYAEGKAVEVITLNEIQIDIFTKGSYIKIRDAIKEVMAEKGYERGVCGSMFEKETKLYHYLLRYEKGVE